MTLPQNRYSEIAEQAEKNLPESWIFSEHGALIVGEFVRLEEGHTAFGDAKILVLKTEDGRERSVWLLHSVLKRELARKRPEIGELVAIRHTGKKTSEAGTTYESYNVVVGGDSEAPDWDSLTSEADEAEGSSW